MKKVLLVLVAAIIFIGMLTLKIMASDPAQALQEGIQKKDKKIIDNAVGQLVSQNDEKAYDALINGLHKLGDNPEPGAYWTILKGIASLSNKDVIPKITSYILNYKSKNTAKDLFKTLKSNPSPNLIPLLTAVLEKGSPEMQEESLYQLGSIYVKESIEVIINFLEAMKPKEKDNKRIIRHATDSLENLTSIKDVYDINWWLDWWNKSKIKDNKELIRPKEITDNIDNVDKYRPMGATRTMGTEKVIVVRNDWCDDKTKHAGFDRNYDNIQDVLNKLDIPHTVVGKSELDKDTYSLDDKWAIIFNCNLFKEMCCTPEHAKLPLTGKKGNVERSEECPGNDNHLMHATKLSDKTIQKIRRFVETGGYLFTEDLNIEEIIERAFPKTIMHSRFLPEDEVNIVPAPGAALHHYLKYVFEAPPSNTPQTPSAPSGETQSVKPGEFRIDTVWKIDDESPDIKIIDKNAVTILIVSPKLAGKSKSEGAVAVTFGLAGTGSTMITTGGSKSSSYAPGGRVLHVMSHFGHQKSKLDEFALQNLIVNFLTELSERKGKVGKK